MDLSQVHKDPFDRIIIATALEYKATLASMDGMFFKYPELNDCLMKKRIDITKKQTPLIVESIKHLSKE